MGIPFASRQEMEAIARKAWGEPTKCKCRKNEMRFGSKGSRRVQFDTSVYYDSEAGVGGGYRDLYKLAHGQYPENGNNRQERTPGFHIPPYMLRDLGLPVDLWDYTDKDHNIVSRVVRFEPPNGKTFGQCRPNVRNGSGT